MNGDGYDDLIIGATAASRMGGLNSGETYVVYGGASAPGTGGMLDLSALDGSNGFTLNGVRSSDYSGYSVSSAGDVNGDGYDDLIIGAYGADPNGDSAAGETYVVYGGASAPGTDGVLDLSALDGSNGFSLNGIDEADESGESVSSAGDVNGDGYDDLIIGANGPLRIGGLIRARPMWSMAGRARRAQGACWICRRWTAPTALSSTASTRVTVPAGPCRPRGM